MERNHFSMDVFNSLALRSYWSLLVPQRAWTLESDWLVGDELSSGGFLIGCWKWWIQAPAPPSCHRRALDRGPGRPRALTPDFLRISVSCNVCVKHRLLNFRYRFVFVLHSMIMVIVSIVTALSRGLHVVLDAARTNNSHHCHPKGLLGKTSTWSLTTSPELLYCTRLLWTPGKTWTSLFLVERLDTIFVKSRNLLVHLVFSVVFSPFYFMLCSTFIYKLGAVVTQAVKAQGLLMVGSGFKPQQRQDGKHFTTCFYKSSASPLQWNTFLAYPNFWGWGQTTGLAMM